MHRSGSYVPLHASTGAAGIVEYYKLLDDNFTGNVIRPVNGMSALIIALEKSAKELGATIFTENRIAAIDKQSDTFVLKATAGKRITADKLVIAAPPGSFKKITGSVAEKIQKEEAFQSMKAFPAFKAAAVYSRAWWEDQGDESKRLCPMESFLSNSDCLGWTLSHRSVQLAN